MCLRWAGEPVMASPLHLRGRGEGSGLGREAISQNDGSVIHHCPLTAENRRTDVETQSLRVWGAASLERLSAFVGNSWTRSPFPRAWRRPHISRRRHQSTVFSWESGLTSVARSLTLLCILTPHSSPWAFGCGPALNTLCSLWEACKRVGGSGAGARRSLPSVGIKLRGPGSSGNARQAVRSSQHSTKTWGGAAAAIAAPLWILEKKDDIYEKIWWRILQSGCVSIKPPLSPCPDVHKDKTLI